MNCISVCDGISAAMVAAEGLDYNFLLLSEIESFPRSVTMYRHGAIPAERCIVSGPPPGRPVLWGDFTTIRPRHIRRLFGHADIDALFGGTPCQSYSVAGKRAGLDDPRGELSLEYALLAFRLGVRWFLWENVPGVFSSAKGKDFAAILSAFTGREVEVPAGGWQNYGVIEQAGPGHFGVAWGISDAQYAGVPQRRRRIFVVGHLGDWRRSAAVLFDEYSMQGHPPPRREKGQNAPTIPARRSAGGGLGTDFDCDGGLVCGPLMANTHPRSYSGQDAYSGQLVAHSLRADGFDASEDGTGRGTPIVPVAVSANQRGEVRERSVHGSLSANKSAKQFDGIMQNMAVRRLTPCECERLQGFPDDYTLVPHRGKMAADGPRYKALGNSWAVPCVRRIMERMQFVDRIPAEATA